MQLFPDPPRTFPGQRGVKIVLRAAHVLCAGTFAAAHLLGATGEVRAPWLGATVVSGLLLLATDLYESVAFLLQVRGALVLAKLGVLVLLPVFAPHEGWVLAALVLGSVISSHAPSSVRYRLVFGRGRVRGARTRG